MSHSSHISLLDLLIIIMKDFLVKVDHSVLMVYLKVSNKTVELIHELDEIKILLNAELFNKILFRNFAVNKTDFLKSIY